MKKTNDLSAEFLTKKCNQNINFYLLGENDYQQNFPPKMKREKSQIYHRKRILIISLN